MTVIDILNAKGHDVKGVPSDARLRAAMTLMHQAGIGSVVVFDETGAGPLGIISQTEILATFSRLGGAALDAPVTNVMSNPIFCSHQDQAEPIMERMTSTKNRHVIVLNDQRAMIGVISIGDLVASRISDLKIERKVLRDMARSRMLAA